MRHRETPSVRICVQQVLTASSIEHPQDRRFKRNSRLCLVNRPLSDHHSVTEILAKARVVRGTVSLLDNQPD